MGTARMARPTYEQLEARVNQLQVENTQLRSRSRGLKHASPSSKGSSTRQQTPPRFPKRVKKLLQDSLGLRDRRDAGRISDHGLALARARLEKRLDTLLVYMGTQKYNRRFQNHLAKHRGGILTFLYRADIEATNWPAEQAIRPAVRNRKVFGGNRSLTVAALYDPLQHPPGHRDAGYHRLCAKQFDQSRAR